MIGSKHDIHPDDYRFRRHHSGAPPDSSGPALIALWPILVAGVVFLGFGGMLITRGANSGVTLGGVCLALIGLAFTATFFWLMRREKNED